jgi:hypothetical protein
MKVNEKIFCCNEQKEIYGEKKQSLIQWMVENLENPMAFSSHDCENCWERPGDNIIVGDAGIPFQLCDFCKGEYGNLLSPKVRKRLFAY